MVSKTKLYDKLDVLEAEFLERLIPHLQHAANGSNDYFFCVKQFNASREMKNKTDKITEELIEIGAAVIALREKLGEPTEGTVVERICWYCRQWGDAKNYHRASAVSLAKKFLAEIQCE